MSDEISSQGVARVRSIGGPEILPKLLLAYVGWCALGVALGYAAWGFGRAPTLAILMPVLCFAAGRRGEVFLFAMGYHLATVRFLANYGAMWFGDPDLGFVLWVALGWACACAWALLWTKSRQPVRVCLVAASAFVITLLPPIAVVLPGHPLVAWGYIAEGTAWFGLGLALVVTAIAAAVVRFHMFIPGIQRGLTILTLVITAALLGWTGVSLPLSTGRVVGDFLAFQTGWGNPPTTDEATLQRIEKAALMAKEVSKGPEAVRLVVFPETAIGRYDPSYGAAIRLELHHQAKTAGQSIIVGVENLIRGVEGENLALLIRRDGTTAYAKQRQPVPFSMWAPWREREHFPIDWLANNVLTIEPGLKARVMFCYEEYLPFLHLLNEIRDDHTLVISIANAWAAPTLEATFVQARHTEGMAKLFGRKFLRSENYQPAIAAARRAYDSMSVKGNE